MGTVVVARRGGEVRSAVHDIRQGELDFPEPENDGVKNIRDAKAASGE